jgi:hypothetical protein
MRRAACVALAAVLAGTAVTGDLASGEISVTTINGSSWRPVGTVAVP